MRLPLVFLIFSASLANAQPIVHLKIPAVVFSDLPTRVNLSKETDSIPPYFLQLTENGVDTLWVKSDGPQKYIEPVFKTDEILTFYHFKIKSINPSVIPLWLSILPPLIAIFLALIFKEVIFSLVTGILVGSVILAVYADGFSGLFTGFLAIIDTYVLKALNNRDHLSVLVFSILIGGIVALIAKNGGMKGVFNVISRFANNARNGQLATWAMGVAVFFDDYANILVVGNTMRPITDKLKISREKLAYIVDSTAAPVSAIAFVTTWIGYELSCISSGVAEINANGPEISEGVYSIFLNSLAYAYYPLLTLLFIFWLIWREKDFGPMLSAEKRARKGQVINPDENMGDLTEFKDIEPGKGTIPHAFNAVIPIVVIVFGTVAGLVFTGFENLETQLIRMDPNLHIRSWADIWNNVSLLEHQPQTISQKVGTIIGASNSYSSLLWASMCALLTAMGLSMASRTLNLKSSVETAMLGFKTMVPPLIILVLAWSLSELTTEMHTAHFLTSLLDGTISPWMLPGMTFVLSGLVAFSTGSSWSTMALMYPLILPTGWLICQDSINGLNHAESMAIFYNTVSCVLAGAVLGDHCSPISDTTILSSLSSGCNHLDHVKTQMPYALTVAGIGLTAGTIPASLGLNPWLALAIGFLVCIVIIELFGKKSRKNRFDDQNSSD